jgi:hypothetical protein|nr:MAG TPA: hypothetical protein [Bacteriophage sp.]
MPNIFLYQDTKNKVHHYRDMGIYRADVASSSRKYKFILTCLCVGLLGVISLPFLGRSGHSLSDLFAAIYFFGVMFLTLFSDVKIVAFEDKRARGNPIKEVLDSHNCCILKYCGSCKISNLYSNMDVYYIQWNGGFGLIFDDGDFPGLSITEKYYSFKAAKKNPNRSFVAKGSAIKEESPFNIVNGERIKAIVEEDGTLLFHNISPTSEYRAGKKILSKMTEVC